MAQRVELLADCTDRPDQRTSCTVRTLGCLTTQVYLTTYLLIFPPVLEQCVSRPSSSVSSVTSDATSQGQKLVTVSIENLLRLSEE